MDSKPDAVIAIERLLSPGSYPTPVAHPIVATLAVSEAWRCSDYGEQKIVIALVGWWIQNVVTTQNTGKDYIGIALGILERKDLPEDMQKNKGLREWAVGLLNHYSPKQLDPITSQELIKGETRLPPPRLSPANNPPGFVGVTEQVLPSVFAFNKDKSLRVSVNAEGFLELIQMTTGQSTGSMHTDISSPKAVAFSPDDHYFVIANDLTFEFFEVDSSGNYSEKGPPKWQNGQPEGFRERGV